MDYKNILFIVAAIAAAVAAYAVVEMRSAEVDQSNEVQTEVVVADPVAIAQEQAGEVMEKEDGESIEKMEKEEGEMMDKEATSTEEVMEKEEGDSMEKMEKDEQ